MVTLVVLALSLQVADCWGGTISVLIPGTDGQITYRASADPDYTSVTVSGNDYMIPGEFGSYPDGFSKSAESDGSPVRASGSVGGSTASAFASASFGNLRVMAQALVPASDNQHSRDAAAGAYAQTTQMLLLDFSRSSVPIESVQRITAFMRLTASITASHGERSSAGTVVAQATRFAGVDVSFEGPDSDSVTYVNRSRVGYWQYDSQLDIYYFVSTPLDSVKGGAWGSSDSTTYSFSAVPLNKDIGGTLDITFQFDLERIALSEVFDPATGTTTLSEYTGDGPASSRFAAFSWVQGLGGGAMYTSFSTDSLGNAGIHYSTPATLNALNTLIFETATMLDGSSLESHGIGLYHVNQFIPSTVAAVPEPSSLALLASGGLIGAVRLRRRSQCQPRVDPRG